MATMICKYGKTSSVVRKNFLSYEFLAGPVHLNENHWALLIASIKTRQVIYIDPYGATNSEKDRVLSNWISFCKIRTMKTISWELLNTNHVLQTNTNNCGVFISYFFRNIMLVLTFSTMRTRALFT